MELDREHSKVLGSVLDTLAPADGCIPKASQVGTAERFADLDQVQRERILLSCATSRNPRKRVNYQLLKTVGLLAYLSAIESTQTWASSGYPPPLGGAPPAPSRVTPLRVSSDTTVPTTALLIRSRLENPNIGQFLRLHPHLTVFAKYEDDLRPWDGTVTPYSSEHSIDREHVRAGVKGAVQIAAAAGAKRVWSQHTCRAEYRPGTESIES